MHQSDVGSGKFVYTSWSGSVCVSTQRRLEPCVCIRTRTEPHVSFANPHGCDSSVGFVVVQCVAAVSYVLRCCELSKAHPSMCFTPGRVGLPSFVRMHVQNVMFVF